MIPGKIESLIGKTFRHFKGSLYFVVSAIYDAEADEWKVHYVPLTVNGNPAGPYCRSYANFTELVNGKPRFEEV